MAVGSRVGVYNGGFQVGRVYVHTLKAHVHIHRRVSPHRERRESSRSLFVGERVSEFIDWLPPRGWLAPFARPLCSTLHSTLELPRSPALSPSLSLSLATSKSLSLLPPPCRSLLSRISSHVRSTHPRVYSLSTTSPAASVSSVRVGSHRCFTCFA